MEITITKFVELDNFPSSEFGSGKEDLEGSGGNN